MKSLKMKTLTALTSTACFIALMSLSSCGTPKTVVAENAGNTQSRPVQQMTRSQVIQSISGDWAVTEVGGTPVTDTTPETFPYITLSANELTPDRAVDFCAYNGCNIINGTFTLTGNEVKKAGDYASTMRLCPDAKYEMAMAAALEDMHRIKLERFNNEWFMYLQNSDGQNLMIMRKHNLNFLAGAWRITRINGREVPKDAGIQMVIDLNNYKIHGNAGCNILNGTIAVNMEVENGVRFGNLGTTRMMCPNIELEQEFLQALGQTAVAVPADKDKKALLEDAQGNVLVEMTRMTREELRD